MSEADFIYAEFQGRARTRAANMPTQERAIHALFEAWLRLKELGWKDAMYAPRDNSLCEFIECGSTGIHRGRCDKEGRVWIEHAGDLWPSKPTLFRPLDKKGRT